jgi:hypothetical protein
MRQAFITSYDIRVIDIWNDVEYSANDVPVFSNGTISLWDGSNGQGGSKRVIITYTDCNGYEDEESFYVSYLEGEKSATLIDYDWDTNIDLDMNKQAKIIIYPNPFANNITIRFTGDIFPLEYKVTDLSGKEILHQKTSAGIEIIDLNGLAAGTYVVSAKAGDYNLVQKLVKK